MGTTIMALVFTTILVFVVYFLIHYLGEKHTNKEAQKIWDEYDQRKTEEYENQVERYNETVKEHLYNFYNPNLLYKFCKCKMGFFSISHSY